MKAKEKGITLVALIITIIILLILSAVIIYEITGKNKILNLAIESTQNYQSATKEEIEEFDKLNDKITSPNTSDITELEKEINDLKEENEKLKEELKNKTEMQVLASSFMNRNGTYTYTFTESYSYAIAIVGAANNQYEGVGSITPVLASGSYIASWNNKRLGNGSYSLSGALVEMKDIEPGDNVSIRHNYSTLYAVIAVK